MNIRKVVFLAILLLFAANMKSYSQNPNWITPNKAYLKMYVAEDAMYRISKADFTSSGIDVATIDPRTVKVYNKGSQIPVYFSGEADGVFDKADYFDFYGERNYGGNTKVFNEKGEFQSTWYEYYDLYSDTNVYWVDWGGSVGNRYGNFSYSTATPYGLTSFPQNIHVEKDSTYSLGQSISATDYRKFSVDKFTGEDWYWKWIEPFYNVIKDVSTPKIASGVSTFKLRISGYPATRSTTLANEHVLTVMVNSNIVGVVYADDFYHVDTTLTVSTALLSSTQPNQFRFNYTVAPNPQGLYMQFYFDYFEVQYPKAFTFEGTSFKSTLPAGDTTSKKFTVTTGNSASPVNIYDVKNNLRIVNSSFASNDLSFTAKSDAKIEVINADITKKPLRIKQKQVPNLVTNTTGADYIMVYHKLFESQAEEIRHFRQKNDNFRSFKANVEDIYDVYNYGIENPAAIKYFLKNAYENWTAPKLAYVCLFGRGSDDPKNNLGNTTHYGNLIPAYGNPNSDNYYVNFNLFSNLYNQKVAVGRLSAFTTVEAETIKNKIINYAGQPLDEWIKKSIFVTGGVSQAEQNYFQNLSNSYINNYLKVKPLSTIADKIYRVDGQGGTTYNFQDSILNDFNRGALVMTYSGHAGNGTWDQGLENPSLLANGNKLPLLFSMTCFTAKNSDPANRGFGEKFFIYQDKGAIGYIGCTGWAFTNSTAIINNYLFGTLKDSAYRRQGDLLRVATTLLANDSATFSNRITLNCFNLLGDPATKLLLPTYPEPYIKETDYSITDASPVLNQNVKITAYPKNYGTTVDSLKISFLLLRNNETYKSKDTILRNAGAIDSSSFNFSIDTLGVYAMRISLDPDNWYTQENQNDNVVTIPVNLRNNSFTPLKPVKNSVIKTDTVYFTCLNPDSNPLVNSVQLTLQLDTNVNFSNPIVFINNSPSGVISKFQTPVPVKDSNVVYYWRTNATINGNVSGWSQTQNFTYNNRTFVDARSSQVLDTNITLYLKSKNQFNEANFSNVTYQSGGISIPQTTGIMRVFSLGNNADESSFFIVNNAQINIGQRFNPGLNIVKVRKLDFKLMEFKNFQFNSVQSADSVVAYLNTFDSTNFLMMAKCHVTQGFSFNATLINKLKTEFGSTYADSLLPFNAFWTWSLISYKGAANAQISEDYHRNNTSNSCKDNWCPSNSYLTAKYIKTFGTVTVNLGPAQNWNKFAWEQVTTGGNSIAVDVYGVKKDNSSVLLASNITNPAGYNFDTLNAYTYPNVNLLIKLNVDTLSNNSSPVFKSVNATYNPPYELAVNKNSFHCKDSLVKYAQKVKVDFKVTNPGYKNVNKFYVNWYYYPFTGGKKVIKADTLTTLIAVDSTYKVVSDIVIPRDNSPFASSNTVTVYGEAFPYGQSNEFFNYNNSGSLTFRIIQMPVPIALDVYFDGTAVKNGDFVRKNPEVKIKVSNLNTLNELNEFIEGNEVADVQKTKISDKTSNRTSSSASNDTSGVKIYLNNKYIPYHSGNNTAQLMRVSNNGASDNMEFAINPELLLGDNSFTVMIADNQGIILDSVTYAVKVSNELLVKNFYNYPNPISSETNFIFNIAGVATPFDCKIKIYTVTGKLIKEIIAPVSIGYNQIPWDTRDSDGDLISNGVYLYKMVVEDDMKTETAIQKLVILK